MKLQAALVQLTVLALFFSQIHPAVYAQVNSFNQDNQNTKIIQKIEQVDPTKLKVEKLNQKSEYWKGDIGVIIDQNKKKIQVKNIQKGTVSLGIADIGKVKVSATEGQIIYNSDKVDVVVQAIEGGIRQVVNIKSKEAPTTYEFPIEIPKGYSLKLNTQAGVGIINTKGQIESAILPPWAKDAEGKDIKTWYSLIGTTLTQHIDTTNAVYPILADPAYCSQYTNSVWNEWRGGWDTIRVSPNTCGRNFARDDLSGSFLEVQRKSGRWLSGSRYNSTFWQWKCHAEWAQIFPGTWDLEVDRPDVGYWGTVRRGCNPT